MAGIAETSFPHNLGRTQFNAEFRKPTNQGQRTREYLDELEIKLLLGAAKRSRFHSVRNHCLVLTMFMHGLRVSEASNLRWRDVDLKDGRIHINRLKNGNSGTHYIYGEELRALRALKKLKDDFPTFVFSSERGGRLTASGIQQLMATLGKSANFDFPLHPHMLRHSCGYYLANQGLDTRLIQDWLGHKSISCTVLYTQLSPRRFEGIFKDWV